MAVRELMSKHNSLFLFSENTLQLNNKEQTQAFEALCSSLSSIQFALIVLSFKASSCASNEPQKEDEFRCFG